MDYILYFFLFSFMGWILETVYASVKNRKYISKQTLLNLPMCPVYGMGAVLMIITLTPVKESAVLVFCGGFFVASCTEYLIASFYEHYFGVTWWDYSDNIGNLNGKICVKMSVLWGIIAIVFFKFILPFPQMMIMNMGEYLKSVLSVLLIFVFLSDYKRTLTEVKKYADNEKSLAEGKFYQLKMKKNGNM